jgi:geranylgeranyl pyrophosphate synthase
MKIAGAGTIFTAEEPQKRSHACCLLMSVAEKQHLISSIREYVAEKQLIPPLSVDELKKHANELRTRNNLTEDDLSFIMIMLNNSLWEETVAATPFERRILLLPQCLKHPLKCKAETDEFGLLCRQCGACPIGEFQEEGERLGYVVVVAEGTSLVTKLLESGKIDAVIGVSCIYALEKAFKSISAHAIPSIAIPLNRDGCLETEVDREIVLAAIRRHSNTTGIGQVDLNAIKESVNSWFEDSSLKALFKNGNNALSETEEIALNWMGKSGKRWRPLLTAAVYSALTDPGGVLSDIIIKPAIAVESFHKASLIHDDIEDDDNVRYGEVTLHKKYGIPIALNLGDLLIGEGYRFIGEAPLPKDDIAKMLKIAAECHRTLSLGQGAELLAVENMTKPLSMEEIKVIFKSKTSPAFEAALAIGAVCAGADDEIFPILKEFSRALGMAYQIKDDIDDLEEHKLPPHPSFRCSLLFTIAYEHGSENEKQRLCACLKKDSEGDCCIDLISSKKTLEKAGQLYEHYKNRAIRSLSPLKNAPLKSFLRKVIQKICS